MGSPGRQRDREPSLTVYVRKIGLPALSPSAFSDWVALRGKAIGR